jgi:hypothetical protein
MICRTMTEPQVGRLLEREDERLHRVLITLHQRLQAWVPFDDHDTSKRDGLLANHTEAEHMLATALCDVTDALADDGIQRSAQQLAEQVEAEVRRETVAYKSHAKLRLLRLRSCIEGWLDDSPHEDLTDLMVELLHLCQHLGITGKCPSAGGAA